MKSIARSAIPLLHGILTIDTGTVRSSAKSLHFSLGQRGPVLATLLRALRAKSRDVRYWTTNDIEEYKGRATVAVPALLHMLKTDSYGPTTEGKTTGASRGCAGQSQPPHTLVLRSGSALNGEKSASLKRWRSRTHGRCTGSTGGCSRWAAMRTTPSDTTGTVGVR